MNKYIKFSKIEFFLIIGFLISTFSFSLIISSSYSIFKKVLENNTFNDKHYSLNIEVDEDSLNLRNIINEIQKAGNKKMILQPLADHIKIEDDYFLNGIWSCTSGVELVNKELVKGRYFTDEELDGEEKLAVVGSGMERVLQDKNGEKYIKIYEEEYKVIGIIQDNEYFKYSSIVPISSVPFINDKLPIYSFFVPKKDYDINTELSSLTFNINNIPNKSIINELKTYAEEFENTIYQIILGISNLLLFSYFFAKSIKKRVAIMRVLGAKNIDVAKDVFLKLIKIGSIGIIGGLIISKYTVDFMAQIFDYTPINVENIAITSVMVFMIAIIVTIVVLFNVLKFKIIKDIR